MFIFDQIQQSLVNPSSFILLIGFIFGISILVKGGDILTKGAASISNSLNINPIIVGLTVVSLATSLPEMVTSLVAAKESPDLAIGNILGSNMANIGLILGITALLKPLQIASIMVRREVPILIVTTSFFVCFMYLDNSLSRLDGIFLLTILVIYLIYLVKTYSSEKPEVASEFTEELSDEVTKSNLSIPSALFAIVFGGTLLAIGAKILVASAVISATRLGVSESFIGITIVAIGTSLPELAASIAAVRAGHSDICAGNIVGSNMFNILLIGGVVPLFTPIPVDASLLSFEIPVMFLLTSLLLLLFNTDKKVSRPEGAFLLLCYLSIMSYLTINA